MNASQNEIDDQRLLEVVRKLCSNHGVRLEQSGEWLVSDKGFAFSASAVVHTAAENDARIRLDIDVSLPGGRLITESFAGVGKNVSAAANDAVNNFVMNSLHVFLTAFFGCSPEDQAIVETWEVDGVSWQAVIGNYGIRGSAEFELPGDLFGRIKEAIRSSELNQDIHWFRIFYGHRNNETIALECLMDNLPWMQAEQVLADTNWARSPGFYTIRNFATVVRDPPESPKHLEINSALQAGLEIVIQSWVESDISEVDLYRKLTNAGIDGDTAERLIIFVPVGFSNVLLSGAQLPSTYIVADENGKPGLEYSLASEPAFRLAYERAQQSSRELLNQIGSHCAMMNAAMKLVDRAEDLGAGQIKDMEFVPLLVFIPRFSPPSSTSRSSGGAS